MKGKVWKILCILLSMIAILSAVTMVHAVETPPSVAWSQTYSGFGEIAHSVIQTKDGGFLLLCSDWPPKTCMISVAFSIF